jgi:hypothetical protein
MQKKHFKYAKKTLKIAILTLKNAQKCSKTRQNCHFYDYFRYNLSIDGSYKRGNCICIGFLVFFWGFYEFL